MVLFTFGSPWIWIFLEMLSYPLQCNLVNYEMVLYFSHLISAVTGWEAGSNWMNKLPLLLNSPCHVCPSHPYWSLVIASFPIASAWSLTVSAKFTNGKKQPFPPQSPLFIIGSSDNKKKWMFKTNPKFLNVWHLIQQEFLFVAKWNVSIQLGREAVQTKIIQTCRNQSNISKTAYCGIMGLFNADLGQPRLRSPFKGIVSIIRF